MFDLCRLFVGFSPEAFSTPGLKERFFETVFKASKWAAPWSSPLPKARETNILLVLRTLANAVREDTKLIDPWLGQVNALLTTGSHVH